MLLGFLIAASLASAPAAKPGGRWMTHKVERGDTVERVAKRWGATPADVRKWNPWVGDGGGRLKPGRVLQVRGSARPQMKMHAAYYAGPDDTWQSLSERFGTSQAALRRTASAKPGEPLTVGTRVIVSRERGASGWNPYAGRQGPEPPRIDVDYGGLSVGRPNAGSLVHGIALPQTELFDLWKPELAYGSTHAVRTVVDAVGRFRQQTGWTGTLTIGSMSQLQGGTFPPHKSHQSGRDVDIRLPRLDGAGTHPSHEQVDWHATWALIGAFLETEQTEVIFLSRRLHGLLREAARDMGASPRELARIGTLIVHSRGHNAHIHVRIRCGGDESDCRSVAGH